jgi:hypothetical protein
MTLLVSFRSWKWIVNMGRTDLLGTEINKLHPLFVQNILKENALRVF